ncbi:MAG TPA: methyltransferase domain-containing protein, partial [Actinoplanes sp.]|nr:methyltransferase domain-containing protein [Actinoplanes sp.]
MIDAAMPYLRCPVCGGELHRSGTAVRCAAGHSYDLARQGYVNLTTGRMPHAGDTAEMVAARAAFLDAGHYDLIAQALGDAAGTRTGLVVDAGTGTGRYLAAVLDRVPDRVGLGLDVSKAALRRAARAHPRAGAALVDLWRPLPLAAASAAVLLNVFAPRNGAEFRRVLRPDGVLLVVTPAADHLTELIGALGLLRVDSDKAHRVAESLAGSFASAGTSTHRRTMTLTHQQVHTLVAMGPSAWHTEPQRLAAAVAA